jgi:hypothetical protein
MKFRISTLRLAGWLFWCGYFAVAQATAPAHPLPHSYKSPVMRRIWETPKRHQQFGASIQKDDFALSPFLSVPPMYADGSNPNDLAIADFNSDGKQDIVVASDPPVLLIGNGDGTFQAPTQVATIGATPTDVAVADFNRDGKMDVAFATPGAAIVCLGNGDGTFRSPLVISSHGANQNTIPQIVAADVNGDGSSDLIVAIDTGVSVMLGNGDGTFQAVKKSTGTVQYFAVADLNNDGHLDIVATNGFSSISVLAGHGDGTFSVLHRYSITSPGPFAGIVATDFNHDGNIDVAIPSGQIFVGDGTGALTVGSSFGTSPQSSVVAVADINGDGVPDVVTSTRVACGMGDFGTTGLAIGNGDGTFQPVILFDSGGCNSTPKIGIGDFNGDGRQDVAVLGGDGGSFGPDGLSILINSAGDFFPAAELNETSGTGGVAVGDFDGDGNPDLALSDGSVYLGHGDGTLKFLTNASLNGVAVATGAFTSDGKLSLVAAVECAQAACANGGQLAIAISKGDGTFQPAFLLPSGGFYAESVALGDFDNDGHLDAVVLNNCTDVNCDAAAGSLTLFFGRGDGTFSVGTTLQVNQSVFGGNPLALTVGDFNNDANLDIAVVGTGSSSGPGIVSIFPGNGDGTFQTAIVFQTTSRGGVTAVTAADFNHDGILDLGLANGAVCSDCGGHGSIMYGNGDGTFGAGPTIGTEGGPPASIVAADFYGTGNLTSVLSNHCGDYLDCPRGSVMIDGTANQTDIMLGLLGIGDFNNDGKPDLAGSLQFDAGATVLLNVGASLAATNIILSPAVPQSYQVFQTAKFAVQISHTGPGSPTGMVDFRDSGTSIGTATVDQTGYACLSTSALMGGTHFIVAYYLGDSGFAPTSSLGTHVIVAPLTTTTSVSSNLNPSTYGQAVTFTSTVISSQGTPTGTVTFSDGIQSLGTSPLNNGVATLTTSLLNAGNHAITALYNGSADFLTSTSNSISQIVNPAATTTAFVSSINPSVYGQSVMFTITVGSANATPVGTVSVMDANTVVQTLTLNANGVAQISKSEIPVGTYPLKAVYHPNANFTGSASAILRQIVNKASTTTTLTQSSNTSRFGQPVTFTAIVKPAFSGKPAGSVVFKDGSTEIGTVSLNAASKAAFTTSILSVGTHSITATYNGNASFISSTSVPVIHTVTQ